ELDARIQAYLRDVTARERETERIGPFLATFSRSSANPFLNYAIPDDGAAPSADEIADLIRSYERHGLRPRLEYITRSAPLVEAPLLEAGFRVEGRLALMTSRRGEECTPPIPPGIELRRPETDGELLGVRTVQHEAYGEPEPATKEDAQRVAANLRAGGMAVLARVQDTGEPVGAGEYTPILDGVTEITSIAVRAPYRRRGIAAAMTVWLARAALAAGATVPFLMANEAEERIYARAGFRTTSSVLHISR
ncbi:MAG TPA: GNAT family N-acetyltransferase, partial [Chloroflexota bacterium]|nr:GNAT family N-acetyltransferase [Chloroflexota bacterium]